MLFQIKTINGQKTIVPLTADTGTGAPVGSIIVVCSNILPSGYLGLGVQYDITNYPALYQVLGTDTTPTASALGLPTLSSGQYAIKATSGLTENQQETVLNTINENLSYSTSEHKTGKKWIDGKDIYQKDIPILAQITHDEWSLAGYQNISALFGNAETITQVWINGDGLTMTAIASITQGLFTRGFNITTGYITVEYTKTNG